MHLISDFAHDLKREFKGYNGKKFSRDLMAGITVAAVALPLALAFGVSSGADAAAGLVTAIIAGIVIGGLSGASYQISGPTGAMAAILMGLSATHGISGVLTAGLFSGVILLIVALLRADKLVSYIPSPVITGFTSGIAIIIANKNEDKVKAKKMLVNYGIGLIVIFAILVAVPYLVQGVAVLVTG